MCQFLGAVAQNMQETGQKITADACAPAVAQPAPQQTTQPAADISVTLPGNAALLPQVNTFAAVAGESAETTAPQPAADASVARPENAALLPGTNAPEAPAVEGAETTSSFIAAPGSEDKASVAGTSGTEDAVIPAANDKIAAPIAVGADQQSSPNADYLLKQEKPEFEELLAKLDPSEVVVDENTTGEPAGPRSNALLSDGDFSTVLHQESSGIQNAQTQLSGAALPHRTHEGGGTEALRPAMSAESLDPAPVIVKDGNRLAVKFEQEGLGKLDLDLRLDKGIINARIQVADDGAKTLIENNTQQIVDSLLKAGLSIGGFSVSLKGGGGQHGTPGELYGSNAERTAGPAEVDAGIAPRAAASGLVSIFI